MTPIEAGFYGAYLSARTEYVAITAEQKKRLLYARHMLGRAAELQTKRSELLVAESLLLLHDASEMVMEIVYEHNNIAAPKSFMEFWSALPKGNLEAPPFPEQMRKLNALRVEFKHRGIVPNPRVVRAIDPEVRAFCSAISSMYLHFQLDSLTLADLIESPTIRDYVKSAEALYAEGKIADALVGIANAFHAIWTDAETNGVIFVHTVPIGRQLLPGEIGSVEPQLVEAINLVLLGIDLPTYSLYCRLVPAIARSPYTESTQVQWPHQPQATPEHFSMLVTFITDVATSVAHAISESGT